MCPSVGIGRAGVTAFGGSGQKSITLKLIINVIYKLYKRIKRDALDVTSCFDHSKRETNYHYILLLVNTGGINMEQLNSV